MGSIKARFIVEISGKPQENVLKALNKFKEEFEKEEELFKLISCELEEPKFSEESKLYSGFLELDAKFSDVADILSFVADYNPTSVEIEEPDEIKLDMNELSGILNDMSSMLLNSNIEKHKLRYKIKYLENQLKSKK